MRLETLHYFIKVVERKSINLAAKDLYISHQALNTSLDRLEKEMGIQLLIRNKKGVTLTIAGEEFFEFCKSTIDAYQDVMNKLDGMKLMEESDLGGRLNIYSTMIYTITFLPNSISKFSEKFPRVKIATRSSDYLDAIRGFMNADDKCSKICLISVLKDNENDIVKLLDKTNYSYHPLFESQMCFFANKESPLVNQEKITLNDLKEYKLIVFNDERTEDGGMLGFASNIGINGRLNLDVSITTSSYKVWLNAVNNKNNVGILYDVILQKDEVFSNELSKLVLLKTDDRYIGSFGYIVSQEYDLVVQKFIEILRDNLDVF